MKKLIGISGIVLAGIAVALVAVAAAGDVSWVGLRQDGPDLSGAQKTGLATIINADWGAGTANQLDSEKCHWDLDEDPAVLKCTVAAELSLTDDQYWAKRKAGEIRPGQATTIVTSTMDVAEDYGPVTQSLFSLPMDEVYSWEVYRDEEEPTIVHSAYWPIVVGSKAAFRAADSAQPTQVVKIIGDIKE